MRNRLKVHQHIGIRASHHVNGQRIRKLTGITSNLQPNVDFYAGFLGLKLVKRTRGNETVSSCTSSKELAPAVPARQ